MVKDLECRSNAKPIFFAQINFYLMIPEFLLGAGLTKDERIASQKNHEDDGPNIQYMKSHIITT
jgi:hypothetical protein